MLSTYHPHSKLKETWEFIKMLILTLYYMLNCSLLKRFTIKTVGKVCHCLKIEKSCTRFDQIHILISQKLCT